MLNLSRALPPDLEARVRRRRGLRISAEAVACLAGVATQTVYRVERGTPGAATAETVQRYIDAVDVLAGAVEQSLARLDQIAASGVRPMTPAELRGAVTGGDV